MGAKPGGVPQGTGHPLRVFATAGAAWTATWVALGSLHDWGAYWLALIFAGFLAPELYGVFVNPAFTLSRQTWAFEHLDFGHPLDFAAWTPVHFAVSIIVWGLFAWLSVHIPFAWIR